MALHHLPIGPLKKPSELELIPRCEPSTYQPISRCINHCVVSAGMVNANSECFKQMKRDLSSGVFIFYINK